MPPEGGHYLAMHLGLLDDEAYVEQLSRADTRPWLDLFLQLAREPVRGLFKDDARIRFVLRQRGYADGPEIIARLVESGWLVGVSGGITIKGWSRHADRLRPTTTAERATRGEAAAAARVRPVPHVRHGAEGEERRGEESNRERASVRERALAREGREPITAADVMDGMNLLKGTK